MGKSLPLPADQLRETLLAELRCASLRARLAARDIDAIATALRFNLVTAEAALRMLDPNSLPYLRYERGEAA